jgi:NCAIR mutase (PurE)-related protein
MTSKSGDARLDHDRRSRTSLPEVVLAERKTREQTARIMHELHARAGAALATRVPLAHGPALQDDLPGSHFDDVSRTLRWGALPETGRTVAILCAGTSDLPVAEEAAVTLEFLGHQVMRAYDVGVAGLHRVLGVIDEVDRCGALIVVAGMEGALPSVVGGLVQSPVIAVPTSVGYGASFGGIAALLAMLNGCAPGVAVVNIDNGFGAAAVAHKIVSARA